MNGPIIPKFSSWDSWKLVSFTVFAWVIGALMLFHETPLFERDKVYQVTTTHYRYSTPAWTNVAYQTGKSLAAQEESVSIVARIIGIAFFVAGAASVMVLVDRHRHRY